MTEQSKRPEHITAEGYPISGIYEHYKSTPEDRKYYQVIGVARHTESGEDMVVYMPVYFDVNQECPGLQIRPLDMFMEQVSINGVAMPRFEYIGQSF